MGYLNKATITVDAILTNRGRELLAQGTGTGNFNITKFAVADDEIDYRLYRVDHPGGSPSYGKIIENMPVLEATSDETQIMRYKLVTADPMGSEGIVIPQITNIGYTSNTLYFNNVGSQVKQLTITPKTTYTTSAQNQPESEYTILVGDSSLVEVKIDVAAPNGPIGIVSVSGTNARRSITARGKQFTLTALNKTGNTTVTIFGGESGASYSFQLGVVGS
jgi:hypothetical protein